MAVLVMSDNNKYVFTEVLFDVFTIVIPHLLIKAVCQRFFSSLCLTVLSPTADVK